MIKKILSVGAVAGALFGASAAADAASITFSVDGADSYVSGQENCNNCGTSISAQIVPYLTQTFTLSQGQQEEFGFFTVTVSGNGSASASVYASLAFTQPVVGTVSDSGEAVWSTAITDSGVYSNGTLTWANIPEITLPNGSLVNVSFTNIDTSGAGNTSGVDVIVRADQVSAVPLPGGVSLFIGAVAALGGLGWLGMRRHRNAAIRA